MLELDQTGLIELPPVRCRPPHNGLNRRVSGLVATVETVRLVLALPDYLSRPKILKYTDSAVWAKIAKRGSTKPLPQSKSLHISVTPATSQIRVPGGGHKMAISNFSLSAGSCGANQLREAWDFILSA
jgi:hypothetical protein